ncbi:methyltransferase-like protein 27 [Brachionichthys hirsutus]|uniref:methyltransferase-like protein 27 n=1 Tax=Brachionichthys hirsutus TaxID=412623 RepID=UPI0036043778
MSSANTQSENAKKTIASVLTNCTPREQVDFYNSWANNYDTDMASAEYRPPLHAAKSINTHFSGDREAAVVLDVACGTGLLAKELKTKGFRHFVGIDGSKGMLELAKQTGLYRDLKQCLLGEDPLPVQWGVFDVVAIVGALIVGHVPVSVVREFCNFVKPGGYMCMTARNAQDSSDVKSALEHELKQMVEEGLITCVAVTEEKEWLKLSSGEGHGDDSGVVYLYRKP